MSVHELAQAGMSTRAIAPVVGVSPRTAAYDLEAGVQDCTPEPTVNAETGEVSDDSTVGGLGNTHPTAATHTQEEQTMSTITAARQSIRTRLYTDDPAKWRLWLVSPRAELGWTLSNLGAAISRLGNRIHEDAPGDYSQGQLDGQQIATIYASVATRTAREDVRRLLSAVNLPCDDDALDRLGWGRATA